MGGGVKYVTFWRENNRSSLYGGGGGPGDKEGWWRDE